MQMWRSTDGVEADSDAHVAENKNQLENVTYLYINTYNSSGLEWVIPCEWTDQVNHTFWFHFQLPHVALHLGPQPVIPWVSSIRWRQKFDWADVTHGWCHKSSAFWSDCFAGGANTDRCCRGELRSWWQDMNGCTFFGPKNVRGEKWLYEANRNPAAKAHLFSDKDNVS